MQGGQWQVLYLVERLKDARCWLPDGSPLLARSASNAASTRGLSPRSLSDARELDLIHAHDARAHTYWRSPTWDEPHGPLVVSRRVGFPMKRIDRLGLEISASDDVPRRLQIRREQAADAGVGEKGVIRVVYDGIPIPAAPAQPEPGRVVAVPSKYHIEIAGIAVQSCRRICSAICDGQRLSIRERNGRARLGGHRGDGDRASRWLPAASADCRRSWSTNAPA